MEHIQKITLEKGKTIEINGAILDSRIVDEIAELQRLCNDKPNSGISANMETYKRLILFMASEADYFSDPTTAFEWMGGISSMMNVWNIFRLPGTEPIKTFEL